MGGHTVRLFLRLTTDVDNRLRTLMRHHGEISRYIDEALTSVELASIELFPVAVRRNSPGITAIISDSANARLRAAAKQRGCTVTALANNALQNWLGGKNV